MLGEWTTSNAKSYLKSNAINKSYANMVVKHAYNCMKYRLAFDNRDSNAEEWEIYKMKAIQYPEKFTAMPFPSVSGKEIFR